MKEICHGCIMDNVNRCEETDFPGPIKVINNCLLCLFLMTDASLVFFVFFKKTQTLQLHKSGMIS